jgi:hypothetical protein
MNKNLFLEGMAFLQKLYGKKLEDEIINVYWNMFKNYSDDKLYGR